MPIPLHANVKDHPFLRETGNLIRSFNWSGSPTKIRRMFRVLALVYTSALRLSAGITGVGRLETRRVGVQPLVLCRRLSNELLMLIIIEIRINFNYCCLNARIN